MGDDSRLAAAAPRRSTPVEETRREAAAAKRAFEAARKICRKDDRDFFYACLFLPRTKRDAACVIVAFCRMIQRAVSAVATDIEADAVIDLFKNRLEDIYAARLELPLAEFRDETQNVLAGLSDIVRRYEIPREMFLDFAAACRTDLLTRRYPTFTSLLRYLNSGGGNVASLLACVFGMANSQGREFATKLGAGIRLMTILRNLKSDRDRGFIYLPLEDLAKFKYSERDLGASLINDNFRELMKFEIARAGELLREGSAGIPWLADVGSRLTAASVVVQARSILRGIEAAGFDVFAPTVAQTAAQKLRRFPDVWRLARKV